MRRIVRAYKEDFDRRGKTYTKAQIEYLVAEEILMPFVTINDAVEEAFSKKPFLRYTAAGYEVNKADLKWALRVLAGGEKQLEKIIQVRRRCGP